MNEWIENEYYLFQVGQQERGIMAERVSLPVRPVKDDIIIIGKRAHKVVIVSFYTRTYQIFVLTEIVQEFPFYVNKEGGLI